MDSSQTKKKNDILSGSVHFPSTIQELEDFRRSLFQSSHINPENDGTPASADVEEASGGNIVMVDGTEDRVGKNSKDLKELSNSLYQHDPRLGTEQVVHIIGEAIQAQKQAKMANRFLAIGLVATTLTSVATTTYLAIKQSNHVDALQLNIKESSISDAVVVTLNANADGDQDDQGRIVVGFVALEDVEQSWRDAQKGLTVTSTVTVGNEEEGNELLETVFTVDAANAELKVDVNGNKNYSNLATQNGSAFEVGCSGVGRVTGNQEPRPEFDVCKVFVPGDNQRHLENKGACTIS